MRWYFISPGAKVARLVHNICSYTISSYIMSSWVAWLACNSWHICVYIISSGAYVTGLAYNASICTCSRHRLPGVTKSLVVFKTKPKKQKFFAPLTTAYWRPHAGSRINFGPKLNKAFHQRVFKNGHTSGFCFVLHVYLVISSEQVLMVEGTVLRLNSEPMPQRRFFFGKETVKMFFDRMF